MKYYFLSDFPFCREIFTLPQLFRFAVDFLLCCGFFVLAQQFLFCRDFFILPQLFHFAVAFFFFLPRLFYFAVAILFCRYFSVLPWLFCLAVSFLFRRGALTLGSHRIFALGFLLTNICLNKIYYAE